MQPKRVRGRVSGRPSRGFNPVVLGLAIAAVVALGAAVVAIANPFGGAVASASPGGSEGPVATRDLSLCPDKAPGGLAAGAKQDVTISTSLGSIVIEVDADLAPVAARNFLELASCGYYTGVIFHRVIPGFMIQGGDGQYGWIGGLDRGQVGHGGPGYQFADEAVVGDYTRGTVAMANAGPNTNGSQFFIVVADQTGTLSKSYTIFGHVISGMDVVDRIVSAPRNAKDLPDDPVAMDSVTVGPAAGSSPSPAASAMPSATPAATQ